MIIRVVYYCLETRGDRAGSNGTKINARNIVRLSFHSKVKFPRMSWLYGGEEVWLHTCLTAVPEGGEWWTSSPGSFPCEERALGVHLPGDEMGPTANPTFCSTKKIYDIRVIQPAVQTLHRLLLFGENHEYLQGIMIAFNGHGTVKLNDLHC